MGSLDANYALLSDVSARNRALQARLRGSLPLLWTDNALVMTSAAPRRRRVGLQPEQSAAAGEADQMLLALEGQAGLQVSQRYKRRVEWEVARRIARVDRELQQNPPAQRFWNQKRKEEATSRPSLYRQRAKGAQGAIGRRSARGEVEGSHEDKAGEGRAGVKTTRARLRVSSDKAVQKTRAKPRVITYAGDNEKKYVKSVAISPLPLGRGSVEDKENVVPNAEITTQEPSAVMEEPLWDDPATKEPMNMRLVDDLHADEVKEDNEAAEPVVDRGSKSKADVVPSSPEEAVHDTTPQAPSSPAKEFGFSARTDALGRVDQASDADVASVVDASSPRRRKPHPEDRPSSSIGRQVLSDFRTMPSVASFGARPILSADGLGTISNTRLNADVLRRLFSDLDTDKDGHVNRIETCMALHRLQITVSTAKIISFFRHIHSPAEGQAVRSRNTQHLLMKEVINYKEFVAFVTAAYDQQQQKKSLHRGSLVRISRKEDQDSALPIPAPSTSIPIYSRRMDSPRTKNSTRAHTPLAREQEVRVYEMPDADHEPDALEERVIREIPDLLVSRMLSETTNEAANEAAASVVRKSLESLVGKESVDDQTVKEITQELIREQLRNIGQFNQNDEDDVTGLRRAAAYYNEQMAQGNVDSDSVADSSSSDNLENWVDVLTEEQVSGLVQRIWKDKQASLHHASVGAVDDSNTEDPPTDFPEDQTARWIDEATDTNELEVSKVAILSEKAVQASSDDCQEETTASPEAASICVAEENHGEDAVSSAETISRPILPQTQFARAIQTSLDPSGSGPHELFRPVTSIQILQQLRQQRRTYQATLNSPNDDEEVTIFQAPNVSNRGGDISATRVNLQMKTPLLSSEVDLESAASRSDITDQSHQHSQEHDLLPLPTTEPVLLTEKFLNVGESVSNASSHEFVVRGSISMSSSGLSSTSDNHHLHGMHQEIDHLQRYTRSAPRRHRPRWRRRALSTSGSSVPDSLCSAELSEGEISRDEALELSDGEIFGETKRNYVKRKNATRGIMKSLDDENNLHSSVESGELPSLREIHAGFRRQLVAQSVTSSVESGEIEDGSVPG